MGVADVKERYENDLLAREGVTGVSADLEKDDVVIYVEDRSVCQELPATIEGYNVRCEVTGEVVTLP